MAIQKANPGPGGNCDIAIEIDEAESLQYGSIRKLGFILQRDENNQALYRRFFDRSFQSSKTSSGEAFAIMPDDREHVTDKDSWYGGLGAYNTEPSQPNRYAIGVNVDTSFPKQVILGPKKYTAGIGADQTAFLAVITAAVEFKLYLYVGAGNEIYKLSGGNWNTPGGLYFTKVYEHGTGSVVFSDLRVHDNILYAAAGANGAYVYSTDGATWKVSDRASNDKYADQFLVLNEMLHRIRRPNLHSSSVDGKNYSVADPDGGTVWSSESEIGDTAGTIQATVALDDNILFARDDGVFNLDSGGNVRAIYPELQTLTDSGNGRQAFVWHKKLFYPTFGGHLISFDMRNVYDAAPMLQSEKTLELSREEYANFAGKTRALTGTQDYLFTEIQRITGTAVNTGYRILKMHEEGGDFLWHQVVELETALSDKLWITHACSDGPVLWAAQGLADGYRPAYYILPLGRDPLEDARCRFTTDGVLYEPWDDAGYANIPKRWHYLEVWCSLPAGTVMRVNAFGDDGSTGIDNFLLSRGKNTIYFKKGFVPTRCRLEFALESGFATITPVLLRYMVHSQVLFQKRVVIMATLDIQNTITHGLATIVGANAFVRDLINVMRPVTVTDMFSSEYIMMPMLPRPDSIQVANDGGRWTQTIELEFLETKTYEWDAANPAPTPDMPIPGTSWPGDGTDEGGVAYIGGDSGSAKPWIIYTPNITVASPAFTDLTGALTATGSGRARKFQLHKPDATKAWFLSDNIVSYNPNLIGGGAWVSRLTKAAVETGLGRSLSVFKFIDLETTKLAGRESRVYVLLEANHATNASYSIPVIAKSNDLGVTWTFYELKPSGYPSSEYFVPDYIMDLAVNQLGEDVWVTGWNGIPTNGRIFRSSSEADSGSWNNGDIVMPYLGSATYVAIYLSQAYDGSNGGKELWAYGPSAYRLRNILRSTDGGDSWHNVANQDVEAILWGSGTFPAPDMFYIDPWEPKNVMAFNSEAGKSASGYTFRSTDRLETYSKVQVPTSGQTRRISSCYIVPGNFLKVLVAVDAINIGGQNKLCLRSVDGGANYTDKTGDAKTPLDARYGALDHYPITICTDWRS